MTVLSYKLRDASGALVAVHERGERENGAKTFTWRQPDGSLGLAGTPVAALPLYGIERLSGSATVLVVEGEKATDALLGIGVQAVGTVTGASATPSAIPLAELGGRRVVLWPDNDEVGRAHRQRIGAASLELLPTFVGSTGPTPRRTATRQTSSRPVRPGRPWRH